MLVDTGKAATQALQSRTFDLVIVDYQMPALNGVEVVRRLRPARLLSRTPAR